MLQFHQRNTAEIARPSGPDILLYLLGFACLGQCWGGACYGAGIIFGMMFSISTISTSLAFWLVSIISAVLCIAMNGLMRKQLNNVAVFITSFIGSAGVFLFITSTLALIQNAK